MTLTEHRRQVCFVFLIGFVVWTHAQSAITSPKYYHGGKLRCNCRGNIQCDGKDGKCPRKRCADPFRGVSCQHVGVKVSPKQTPMPPTALLDGDDKTCVGRYWSGQVMFEMTEPANFVWIYVARKLERPMRVTLVVYKSGSNVELNLFTFKIDNKSLLIRPKPDMGMWDQISVAGLPQDACSLEISLGRNLVMPSQTAIGSKSTWNTVTKGVSKLIADGNEDRGTGKCHAIKYQGYYSDSNIWRAELVAKAKINRVVVLSDLYTQCGGHGGLTMWTVIINLLDESGKVLKTFVDKSGQPLSSTMSFDVNSNQLAKKLEVVLNRTFSSACAQDVSVDLCEIYAYGEFVCPDGKYGPYCERDCPGCTRELCDPDVGCPQGCNENWKGHWCDESCVLRYGPNCTLFCPNGCAGIGDCNTTTGACLEGCRPGLYTATCIEPCPPGTFGQNCSKTCSHCAKNETTNVFACDPEEGQCLIGCEKGFGGDQCERIIVQDDAVTNSTKYALAGFAALAILLLYKSATQPSDDLTTTEEEVEEQKLVQTEPKVKKLGTMESLAKTSSDPQRTQAGPNRMEEPVKTKPETSVDKRIESSNASQKSQKKPNLKEEPVKTELKSSERVNIGKKIKSSNGSQITQKESSRMEEPVKIELKNSELVSTEKVIESSNGSQKIQQKPKIIEEPPKTELKNSKLVSTEKVIESSNGTQKIQKKPKIIEEPAKTELKNLELENGDKMIDSSNGSQITRKKPNLMEEPMKRQLKSSVFKNAEKVIEPSNGSQITPKESRHMEEPVKTPLKRWKLVTMGKVIKTMTGSQVTKKKQNRTDDQLKTELMTSDLASVEQVDEKKGKLVSMTEPKRHNDDLNSKAEQSPIELNKEAEPELTKHEDTLPAKKRKRSGPMLFLKRLSGQKCVITDSLNESPGPIRLRVKTNPEKEILKNEGK